MAVPAFGKTVERTGSAHFFSQHKNAGADSDHFKKAALHAEALRNGHLGEIKEIQDDNAKDERLIGAIEEAENNTRRFNLVKNPKTGEDEKQYLPSEADAPRARIAERKQRLEEVHQLLRAMNRTWAETINEGANDATLSGHEYREVAKEPYANDEPVSALTETWNAEFKEGSGIFWADKTDDEITEAITRDYNQVRDAFNMDLKHYREGAHTDYRRGEAVPGARNIGLVIPQKMLFADSGLEVTGSTGDGEPINANVAGNIIVNVDDATSLLFWLDDGTILQRLIDRALSLQTGRRQISMADRPGLLREQRAKILHARRRLEFAIRREEAKGLQLARPTNSDWTVLCWVERVSKQTPLKVIERESKPVSLMDLANVEAPRPINTKRGPAIVQEDGTTLPRNPGDEDDEANFG